MSKYAKNTSVSSERSKMEIERTIMRYGAEQFVYGWHGESAVVGFRMQNRQIKFELALPRRDDPEFCITETGRERSENVAHKAWEQATRQRWRALLLIIKAKFEATELGVTSFENEFLACTMLPSGETVGQWARRDLDKAMSQGKMPRLLPE